MSVSQKHKLAKVGVEGSNPFARSKFSIDRFPRGKEPLGKQAKQQNGRGRPSARPYYIALTL